MLGHPARSEKGQNRVRYQIDIIADAVVKDCPSLQLHLESGHTVMDGIENNICLLRDNCSESEGVMNLLVLGRVFDAIRFSAKLVPYLLVFAA
jgi:hypothetical protein